MRSDRIFGLATLVVALFYIWSATTIQLGFLSDPVGSRTFPYLIGAVAALCALYMLVRPDPDPVWPSLLVFGKIAAAVAVMYVFSRLLKPAGFIIPAAGAAAMLSYLLKPDIKIAVMTGVGLSVGLYTVFSLGLGLSLSPFGKLF